MDSLYLVDSGGQYEDGTTDITRTLAIGEPTAEMRDRFTRVLQGPYRDRHRALPQGHARRRSSTASRGGRCGRRGSIMPMAPATASAPSSSVHEGPQRISPVGSAPAGGDEPLQAGMILSNEPGYYKAGEYGIRIENLVLVVEKRGRRARKRRCSASRR